MTNFERIKNMNADDLADLLHEQMYASEDCDGPVCGTRRSCFNDNPQGFNVTCLQCIKNWLQEDET